MQNLISPQNSDEEGGGVGQEDTTPLGQANYWVTKIQYEIEDLI